MDAVVRHRGAIGPPGMAPVKEPHPALLNGVGNCLKRRQFFRECAVRLHVALLVC